MARCAGVSAARVNPPSGPMYPQCDWLGPLACALDTRLCYNRPFPVAGLGQCFFLLLSPSAQLAAQIRLLKENRGLPLALHFFAVQFSLSVVQSHCCCSPFPTSLYRCKDGKVHSSPPTLVFLSWKLTQNGCQGITSQGEVPLNNLMAESENKTKQKNYFCL